MRLLLAVDLFVILSPQLIKIIDFYLLKVYDDFVFRQCVLLIGITST